jgi:tripartite-type tricarboxylate transporter receptor subunit TctC
MGFLANFSVRAFFLVLSVIAAITPAQAEYPERPIKAIVPFAPGGANDTMARLLAPHLSKVLGQSIVIENRPGAAGNLGIEVVAKSAPDGYTLVFSATASTQNPALFKVMPFDPLKDIKPVAKIGEGPYVIAVNPKLPVSNLADLVDYARKNPGKLNAAAGGIGTRLSVELFDLQNDLKIEIIPYDGTGPASVAVLGGEVDLVIMDTSAIIGSLQSGRIKPLAVAAEKRLPSLPNTPTTTEAGFPRYKTGTLFGLYAQGNTPNDIVNKINGAMNKVLAMPEVIEALRKLGAEPDPRTPEEFFKQYAAEITQWKEIVSKAKIPLME